MQLFYTEHTQNKLITLDAIDSKHCCKVLRKRVGEEILVTNGRGVLYTCEIVDDNMRACVLQIKSSIEDYGKRKQHLHIAIAPTKKLARIEWFIEKAVEIGVEQISFIQTNFTEKINIKLDRFEKIAIAAMKQSGRAYVPILNELKPLATFLEEQQANDLQKFIAYVPEDNLHLKQAYEGGNVLVLVGPEGGFSKDEIELCKSKSYREVSLGAFRFRTETAGIVTSQIIADHFVAESKL